MSYDITLKDPVTNEAAEVLCFAAPEITNNG